MSLAKVFGIGLSRTGTSSLAAALGELGWSAVHYPADERTRAELAPFLRMDETGPLRLSLLECVDALTDTPVCCVYRQLDQAYPGSKFVLTVRDEAAWLASCQRYWSRTGPRPKGRTGLRRVYRRARLRLRGTPEFRVFADLVNRRLYGDGAFEATRFLEARERYERGVRDYFVERGGDLLELDVCDGQGWDELCAFLGVAPPQKPFPWTNRRQPRTEGLALAQERRHAEL